MVCSEFLTCVLQNHSRFHIKKIVKSGLLPENTSKNSINVHHGNNLRIAENLWWSQYNEGIYYCRTSGRNVASQTYIFHYNLHTCQHIRNVRSHYENGPLTTAIQALPLALRNQVSETCSGLHQLHYHLKLALSDWTEWAH